MHERLLHGSPELFVNGKNEKMDFIMCLDFEILHLNAIFQFHKLNLHLILLFFQLWHSSKHLWIFVVSLVCLRDDMQTFIDFFFYIMHFD